MTTSTILHPWMISIPVSPYCELARWVLDLRGIAYVEDCHAPVFHVIPLLRYGGGNVVPALDTGETALHDARAIVNYYEARSRPEQALYPSDLESRREAQKLFDFFFDHFGVAARAWAYAYMLPHRSATSRAWVDRAPWWERAGVYCFYPLLASLMRKSLQLNANSIVQQQAAIEAALAQVEARLADGRPFLMGDKLTAADLAFAALAAPIIIPPQYGGPMPSLEEVPTEMKRTIEGWRSRPAGRFILRLYANHRPPRTPDLVALGQHGSGRTFKDKLANFLIRPVILRPIFALLRRWAPIFIFGKNAAVTRFNDVVEVLQRDADFTIGPINAAKIDRIDGPFILGMDQSPQYQREKAALLEVVRREDLEGIRQFAAESAAAMIEIARPQKRIDVVNGLARIVPLRLVATYFGMPGPDDPTMMRWMRDVFHYIFADLTNSPTVLQDALNSSAQLRKYMDTQIAQRKSAGVKKDDVLGRLLALQDPQHPWLDDNAVRRNLGGVIVGAVDTTSKFVTLAIDELLRRPKELVEASECAARNDAEAVRGYAYEAVRFNPHHPLQVRFCAQGAQLAAGQTRSKNIPSQTHTYVATLSAMFDPDVFTNPAEFNPRRQTKYLHFGDGLHTCFGKAINGVQIPEILAALLRLPGLRRASGSAGQILYDGPFPNRLILEFDS